MDARNATQPATTKPAASPPRDAVKEHRASPRSSPPMSSQPQQASNRSPNHGDDQATAEGSGPDPSSDAETIVLPGKDGISPSKPRKVIKHEDRSDGEVDRNILSAPRRSDKQPRDSHFDSGDDDQASFMARKKRLADKQLHSKDVSNRLSSTPASPSSRNHRNNRSMSHNRRSPTNDDSNSDSDSPRPRSNKSGFKAKARSVEGQLPGKRKVPKTESDEEAESRKARRQRISDVNAESHGIARGKDSRPSSSRQHLEKHTASRTRSPSPHGRPHRRSLSTQLPSQTNGLGTKKRRPAPLQSTTGDYLSDDSSASGSTHPRSSKLKKLATPGTGDSTHSPAKITHYKRHVDNHGQTQLAKACAKGEYDLAKRRLTERPEDLNFADYAGNTPLQIASLAGHEQIVKLLIEAGCNLDCRNSDKETPLLDAVENGHISVVRMLLDAGVNPRKADAEGHEPLEKVPDDLDNAEEIRAVLQDAKDKMGELRRTSEDHLPQDIADDLSSRGADSPRRSPPPSATGRRGGTVRSNKTSNHLLYMNLDEKTLRAAAGKGDEETVTRVLLVREGFDDPESLVAAARGGHNVVMELLLALGKANPDPPPVDTLPAQYSTPMLAAIGQENLKVVELLLSQNGFDPTRRFKGETYYEIARRREGPMWKEEETILKDAFDGYKRTSSKGTKKHSPNRRDREMDPETRRAARAEAGLDPARLSKRRPSSPNADSEPKRKQITAKILGSPREKARSSSFGAQDEQTSPKRGPGRPKKEERAPVQGNSDREQSPSASRAPPPKAKRAESELAAASSDGDSMKPHRRKLISGKDLKGEREKQRRASLVSNTSTTDRSDAKPDDPTEKSRPDRPAEKYHDRTKALKRDDSKDRLSVGDTTGKRHRSSMTPPRQGSEDKHDSEGPTKRRKLDPEAREKRRIDTVSPDRRKHKRDASREPLKTSKAIDAERKDSTRIKKVNRERSDSGSKAMPADKTIIASHPETNDIDMRDAPDENSATDAEAQAERERKEAKKLQIQAAAAEEVKAREQEAKRRQEEEEEEAKKKKRLELEQKRQREEAEKKQAEEEEKKRADEARKRKLKQEEEEKARLEAERIRKEEETRQREEEEARRKEEERKRREEEEERLRREKEAAEQARKLREEEERKERERKRAAREAEQLRIRQEQESARLAKLPPVLRWLETNPDPKQSDIAKLFAIAQGVRYDTIDPAATGKPGGRDLWLLNTQVALLLGEKDISLSRYTAWDKIPASRIAKKVIWRLEMERFALTQGKLYHLGEQLPDYYGGDPRRVGYKRLEELRGNAAKLFFEMDMFFVRLSDFLYMVPNFPHLHDVKVSVHYRELPETEAALSTFSSPGKWKLDNDASQRGPFAPRYTYYINGQLIGEEKPSHSVTSRSPFPDQLVPRRAGLIAVAPDEPDYARLCVEQGLAHLISEQEKQAAIPSAAHLTPKSMGSNDTVEHGSAHQSPSTMSSHHITINGVKDVNSPELRT